MFWFSLRTFMFYFGFSSLRLAILLSFLHCFRFRQLLWNGLKSLPTPLQLRRTLENERCDRMWLHSSCNARPWCSFWEPTGSATETKVNQLESSQKLSFHMRYKNHHISSYVHSLPLQVDHDLTPACHFFCIGPHLFHCRQVHLQCFAAWASHRSPETTCIFVPLDGRSSKSHMDLAFEQPTHKDTFGQCFSAKA